MQRVFLETRDNLESKRVSFQTDVTEVFYFIIDISVPDKETGLGNELGCQQHQILNSGKFIRWFN